MLRLDGKLRKWFGEQMNWKEPKTYFDVLALLCNVALVALAWWGLRAWRNDVRADDSIQVKNKIRRLSLAASQLIKELLMIRAKKVTNSEIREGLAKLDDKFRYVPQKPQYYAELLDRLTVDFWQANDELVHHYTIVNTTAKVQAITKLVREYQNAYSRYHGTDALWLPLMIPEKSFIEDAEKLKKMVYLEEGKNEDDFSLQVMAAHKDLMNFLAPFLKGEL
jgi:hypothetical protein